MKNILYISHTSQLGGAERSLLLLLERLDRARFNPAVVTPGDGPLVERVDEMGVPWYTVPMIRFTRTANVVTLVRYFVSWRKSARKIKKLLDRFQAHLVHANSTTASLYAVHLLARQRVPRIWHVRDFGLTKMPTVDRAMARCAAAIIVVSNAVGRIVPRVRGVADKTSVIYNGVDVDTFAPGDRTALRGELGLGRSTPVAGIVGQIVPWKGHERFLETARKVSAQVPDARFLVVGDNLFGDSPGIVERLKEKARELGIGDKVMFLGWRDDVAAVMNALDVLVVASENEPFGRVVIEAMACETPVVAFRCGGPAEIIEHDRTGLLAEPFDVDAMADAMTALLADPDRAAALGRGARQAVCEKFSADRYVQSIQDLYDRLLQ